MQTERWKVYLDCRVGEELKGTNMKDQDTNNREVAMEDGGEGEVGLGLELEAGDEGRKTELNNDEG